jgi:xanthine dehydrogenase accessory factor
VRAAAVERRAIAVMTIVACKREASAIALGAKWTGEPDGSLHGTLPDELRGVLRALAIQAAAMSKPRCVRLQRTALGWEPSPGDTGELAIFVEPLVSQSQLIIVGAGHIAQELARLGASLEFEVVIVDDRAAYANRSRFPQAEAIFVGPIETVLKERPLGPETYIALVTRGHQQDEAALKVVIASEVAYIGMIGSRRRIKEIFRHLTEAGFDSNLFSKVHAPIGLKIEAETPAEIAVAIAAELVKVRRAGIRARTAAVADVL